MPTIYVIQEGRGMLFPDPRSGLRRAKTNSIFKTMTYLYLFLTRIAQGIAASAGRNVSFDFERLMSKENEQLPTHAPKVTNTFKFEIPIYYFPQFQNFF